MKYLLDTCVISELVAMKPSPKVLRWVDSIESDNVYLSVITMGEIRKRIERLPDSQRRTTLHAWLTEDLLVRFGGRILSIDTEVVLMWGQLAGSWESEGKKMAAIDSLIAASALYNHCTLVTRNETDFKHTGIAIINPWD